MRKSASISRIAIFFAVMITIHFVTSFILQFVPSGIQPTLVHIPVVIASINLWTSYRCYSRTADGPL